VLTRAAVRLHDFVDDVAVGAYSRPELVRMGCTQRTIDAALAADRWQRIGRAIVVHNGEASREERWRAAVVNCGPRAVLGSFSAAEMLGMTGWEREEVHVVAPAGVPRPRVPGLPIVLHRTTRPIRPVSAGHCQPLAEALVLAASSFRSPRPACGLLAAAVQQRLLPPARLLGALTDASRTRHRAVLIAATADIGMGAQALSEIDFVRLCRRNGLPRPQQQVVRTEPDGRRRYLDAEWLRGDGRRVVVEVDGALHLAPRRWFDDQLRQNELMLDGALVLRFPSVVLRTDEPLVVRQLRQALRLKP
jgi:hypothetical protein